MFSRGSSNNKRKIKLNQLFNTSCFMRAEHGKIPRKLTDCVSNSMCN